MSKLFEVSVDPKQTVFVCTCGQSKKLPFCDGSHTNTPFTPLPIRNAGDVKADLEVVTKQP